MTPNDPAGRSDRSGPSARIVPGRPPVDLSETSVRDLAASTGVLAGALLALVVLPSLSAALAGTAVVDVALGAGAALLARRLLVRARESARRRRAPRRAVADGGGRATGGSAGEGCGRGACTC